MWGHVHERQQFEPAQSSIFDEEDAGVDGEQSAASRFRVTSTWGFYRPRDISLQYIKLVGQPSSFAASLITAVAAQGLFVLCFLFLYQQFPQNNALIVGMAGMKAASIGFLILGVSLIFGGLQWWRAGMVGGTTFFRSYNVVSEVWLGMGRLQFGCNERGVSIENYNNASYFVQWPKIDYIYDARGRHVAVLEKFLAEKLAAISVGEVEHMRPLAEMEIRGALFHPVSAFSILGMKNNIRMRLKTNYPNDNGIGDAVLVSTFEKRKRKGWRRIKEIGRDLIGKDSRLDRGGQRIIFEDYLAIPKHFFKSNEMCSWQDFLFYCYDCKFEQLLGEEPYKFQNYIELRENAD